MNDTPPQEDAENGAAAKPPLWRRWLPLIVILCIAGLVWATGLSKYLSLESIATHRNTLMAAVEDNFALSLLAYAGVYIVVVALSLPGGALLTVLGGFLFGWLIGGIATVLAATFGAMVVFLVARSALGETLAARAGPWIEKLRDGFQEDALSYLLFLRLVPVFPFWLVNLAPALLGMALGPYILGTIIGIIPGTFAFSFAGAGLDSIIKAQNAVYQTCLDKAAAAAASAAQATKAGEPACKFTLDPGSLLTKEILLAFVALGVVSLVPVVLKKVRGQKT